MEIQANVASNEICVGSAFHLNVPQPRIADVIVFGQMVTGFVVFAREEKLTVDIKTAVLECERSISDDGKLPAGLWIIKGVLVPNEEH